jgi:hypothetical protein
MDPLDMHPLDYTLESIIREWVASNAADKASVSVKPTTRGGPPAFEVKPHNPAAITITLWVADDGAHVAFWIGAGSAWPDQVALEGESIGELLSAVAAARAGEEVRRVHGEIVARKGCVELAPRRRLTYGELGMLKLVPGLKWESIVYQSY